MSRAETFYISSDPAGCGRRFWFPVYVYKTNDELQKAARKYTGDNPEMWDGCHGCFHLKNNYTIDRKGNFARGPQTSFIGVMRLSLEDIHPGIVVHESIHAAIALVNAMRLRIGFQVGGGNITAEEALCYAAQEISNAINKHLGLTYA